MIKIKRVLISVSDKTGIVDFARTLQEVYGVKILSTGGTYKVLQDAGLKVKEVSEYTGFPEMMDGRVKTLHPMVHGGLLGRRDLDDKVMKKHGIKPIDMVVVNLYPFEQTVAKLGCTLEDAIENIDIGGPTMLRSAAKNNDRVTVVTDPNDYHLILEELAQNHGAIKRQTRFDLAIKTFELTSRYDGVISNYFGARLENFDRPADFSRTYNQQLQLKQTMRYGENPHQKAAFYVQTKPQSGTVAAAVQLQGKELSYNNIADTDAALECVKSFEGAACVIVKHANPCGVAEASSIAEAYDLAFQTDPTSAFGGIIAFNRELDGDTAKAIVERQFVEVIIAPKVSEEAKTAVAAKGNVRLLEAGYWEDVSHGMDSKQVRCGLLVQTLDDGQVALQDLRVVTKRAPTDEEMRDLLFAWKVAKFVKSNAIVYAKNSQTIGVGAGQMSRVYSAKIAGIKAADEGLVVPGSVMASDAFFPFRDGIDQAAEAGIAAIIQPGGSIRDEEVIAAADEAGMAMVFTGMRHFRH